MAKVRCMVKEIPIDFDGLRELMQEHREQCDRELGALIKRERAITESLLSGKTRKGTPLTDRGRRKLLSDLEGIHFRQAGVLMQGSEVCKRMAIWRDNDRTMAALELRDRMKGGKTTNAS